MAVNFLDSVGHYALADVEKKLITPVEYTGVLSIDPTASPAGGPCFKVVTGSSDGTAGVYYRSSGTDTVCVGGRFKIQAPDVLSIGTPLFDIRGISYGTVCILTTASGQIQARRVTTNTTYAVIRTFDNVAGNVTSSYNVILGTSANSGLIASGVWAWVEAKVVLSTTVGVVQVWVNGGLELDLSGLDTMYHASSTTSQSVGMGGWITGGSGEAAYFGEFYLATVQQGDVRVDPHFPDTNGSDSSMTRSTGADDYTLLDETTANTTDYLSSDAVGERTSVSVEALRNTGGSIKSVQVTAYLTKQNAGTAVVKPYVLRGGTRYYGAEWFPAWGSWKFYTYVWDQDPAAGPGAWTESNFNSSEFGLERTT